MKYWVMEPGMAPVMKYYAVFHTRSVRKKAPVDAGAKLGCSVFLLKLS
jgi:hypothetical protein